MIRDPFTTCPRCGNRWKRNFSALDCPKCGHDPSPSFPLRHSEAYKIVMDELKKAETIFSSNFSCEDCPEGCPISEELCDLIDLAGPLKDLREMGIVVEPE